MDHEFPNSNEDPLISKLVKDDAFIRGLDE